MKKTLVVVNSETVLRPEHVQAINAQADSLKEHGYILLVLQPGFTLDTIHDPEDLQEALQIDQIGNNLTTNDTGGGG